MRVRESRELARGLARSRGPARGSSRTAERSARSIGAPSMLSRLESDKASSSGASRVRSLRARGYAPRRCRGKPPTRLEVHSLLNCGVERPRGEAHLREERGTISIGARPARRWRFSPRRIKVRRPLLRRKHGFRVPRESGEEVPPATDPHLFSQRSLRCSGPWTAQYAPPPRTFRCFSQFEASLFHFEASREPSLVTAPRSVHRFPRRLLPRPRTLCGDHHLRDLRGRTRVTALDRGLFAA